MQITLTEALDYERRNSYLINLVAIDGASDPLKRLQAKATVAVDVLDVQVRIIRPHRCALAFLCLAFFLFPIDTILFTLAIYLSQKMRIAYIIYTLIFDATALLSSFVYMK